MVVRAFSSSSRFPGAMSNIHKRIVADTISPMEAHRLLRDAGRELDHDLGITSLTPGDIVPPWTVKTVQLSSSATAETRLKELRGTGYNVFRVKAETILIDLLTDSGTGALSDRMWAEIMEADERYSHSITYEKFIRVGQETFNKRFILPVHQGRAAENITFEVLLKNLTTEAGKRGKPVACLGNTYFDTTASNSARQGAKAIDLPCPESSRIGEYHPFKGNADVNAMEEKIREYGPENIGFFVMTVVNNSKGGQPVSLENQRAVAELAKKHGILYILDAARIFENAYMIQQREAGYREKSITEIVHAMTALADVVLMSAKKDAIANMGGLIATNSEEIYNLLQPLCILIEGHYSYGGMSGRDLGALTLGLVEGRDQEYLRSRVNQVAELGNGFRRLGLPIQWPPGSNGVYLDGRGFLEGVDPLFFPAQRICAEVYLRYGIRPVEIGLSLIPRNAAGIKEVPETDFVRFTIPRRVLTGDHMAFILHSMEQLYDAREEIGGMMYEQEGRGNGHFTSRFRLVAKEEMPGLKPGVAAYFSTPLDVYSSHFLPPNARRAYSFPPQQG